MTPQQKKLYLDVLIAKLFHLLLCAIALITFFLITSARVVRIFDNLTKISALSTEAETLSHRRQILSQAKEADIISYHQTLTRLIPSEESIIGVYQAVEAFASNSGLQISKMSTPSLNQKTEIAKVNFTVKEPLDSFLKKISTYLVKGNRLMTIDAILYNAADSSFDIDASFYWKSKITKKNAQISTVDWAKIRSLHQQFLENNDKIE